ncbi:uncharacterized protein BXZ73DRAFT_104346 [Epithele typhae]|uniref:uncharacterized protein n=1 Tax=Epithele typhae TaxID=378194 RepID=UPI002008CC2C|nr:uncharacterized protein BXZ73DRAFT_104346 [Epithele typhae]KAH9921727.1 hypothetical protein BXZ73DRAFT_104346 [Epithele typhae]
MDTPSPAVHRVPVDVIVEIFALTGLAMHSGWNLKYSLHAKMEWVKLMLVCRLWRDIGLQAPSLWRSIAVKKDLDVLRLLFERSASCTVDLFMNDRAELNVLAMPLLLQHADRIRSISTCRDFYIRDLSSLEPLFTIPLPALRAINIKPTRLELYEGVGLEPETPIPVLKLSAILHPPLYRLQCSPGIVLPSTPSAWSQLTTLKLTERSSNIDNTAGPALRSLLFLLRHTERLRSLRILVEYTHDLLVSSIIPTMEDEDIGDAVEAVQLLHLQNLCLQAPREFALPFLRALKCGDSLHSLTIHIPLFRENDDPLIDIDAVLPSGVRQAFLSKVKRLSVSSTGYSSTGMASSPARATFILGLTSSLSGFSRDEGPYLLCPFVSLCDLKADLPLTELCITTPMPDQGIPLELWRRIFTAFPCMRSLSFGRCTLSSLQALEALCSLASDPDAPPSCATSLRKLGVYYKAPWRRTTLGPYPVLWALYRLCRARNARGVPRFSHLSLEVSQAWERTYRTLRVHRWMLLSVLCHSSRDYSYDGGDGVELAALWDHWDDEPEPDPATSRWRTVGPFSHQRVSVEDECGEWRDLYHKFRVLAVAVEVEVEKRLEAKYDWILCQKELRATLAQRTEQL